MAKVKTLDKHGSAGPSTFRTTLHGVVEHARTLQLDPKTARQRTYRQIVQAVVSQWRYLSQWARAGWNALAGQWRQFALQSQCDPGRLRVRPAHRSAAGGHWTYSGSATGRSLMGF